LPDPSSDPLGRGDDDDVEPMAFHESDEVIIKLRNKGFPFIDALCAVGQYTSVFTPIFGHYDSFTDTEQAIENKLQCILGEPDYSSSLESFLEAGMIPPGGLAYPKYKAASLTYAMSDVEIHVLHSDIHLGPRQGNTKHRFSRGAWYLSSGSKDPVLFPEGYAVLDWESKNRFITIGQRVSRRNERRRR